MIFSKKSENLLPEISQPMEVSPTNSVVSPQPGSESKMPWTFSFLIILLLVVNGVLGYMYYQTKQQLGNQKVSQINLESPVPGSEAESEEIGLANPSATYCASLGYLYDIIDAEEGQYGVCKFPGGLECEAWDFYSGKCGQEFSYCATHGYTTKTVTDGNDPYSSEYAVCLDESGGVVGSVHELSRTLEVYLPTEEWCLSYGGKWQVLTDSPEAGSECNLPTSDAGKKCTDSGDCESYCQAPEGSKEGESVVGICYGFQEVICIQEVTSGVADTEWCH